MDFMLGIKAASNINRFNILFHLKCADLIIIQELNFYQKIHYNSENVSSEDFFKPMTKIWFECMEGFSRLSDGYPL